ncbi:MAG: preprotein translocase subunit SecA [Saprospiraceae bacterium]
MFNFLKNLFGTKYERDVKNYSPIVEIITEIGETLKSLSHDELRAKTLEFKETISEFLSEIDKEIASTSALTLDTNDLVAKEQLYKDIDALKTQRDEQLEVILREIMPEAFAVVKEVSRRFTENESITVTATQHDRDLAVKKAFIEIKGDQAIWQNKWLAAGNEITWNMVHFDVQLIGGMVLHEGKIAEMATGEGKTLVATLPAYLNGLSGEGVHIITVNDYLARRDSEWVGPIYEFLLLTVDCIDKYKPNSDERRQAYRSDICFGTNNEYGFDYLRDNMVRSTEEQVQRKLHFAMVDEVDSVLIDDARTPLIISGPVEHGAEEAEYMEFKPSVERLLDTQKKIAAEFLSEARKQIREGKTGYQEGDGGLSLLRAFRALPKSRPLIKFLSEDGNKVLLQKAENHFMQEQSKNMHIADAPLYFTIDEKNRQVDLTEKGSEFLAKGGNDPGFFLMPDITARIQDIEESEASTIEKKDAKESLINEFSIKSKRLHSVNQMLKAYTLFEKDEEYVVIDGQVKIVDEQTGRMMEGRRYSDGLHQALEAKENVEVGEATQTYATITLQNYFRMFHKLAGMTGTAETEASELWTIYKLDVVVIPTNREAIRKDMEDYVFKTAREKYNAVIDEINLLAEAGRPVLVGTTSVDISQKLSKMLDLRGIKHNVLNAKQHQREAEIVAEAGLPGKVTIATNMAGRGTDIKISDGVKQAGGLAIVGTERHDSRRVDRQLRGRAGRQGDPGTSQFFVSLEDNLMRLFNSERIASLMDRMGHKEGEVIQHSMVTKSIERAQKKVEENNFGIRKRLLEYDDVMNIQRGAIYKKRDHALSGERLSVDLNYMFSSVSDSVVATYKPAGDYEGFRAESMRTLGLDPEVSEYTFNTSRADDLADILQEQVMQHYNAKAAFIAESLFPLVKNVYDNEGHRYKRIMIPFSDGSTHPLPVSADLETAVKSNGTSIMRDIEKTVSLSIIDNLWKEHLRDMDELKESVQGASFEQKDPLVIYKMEAFDLFEQLVIRINAEVSEYLLNGKLMIEGKAQQPQQVKAAKEQKTDFSKVQDNRHQENPSPSQNRGQAQAMGAERQKVETIVRMQPKVGRNDMCPCGSGKKFKNCHGIDA